jgi:Na+-driven multidrug efflux pump
MAWGGLMLILLAIAAQPIAALFNDNPLVVSTIVSYLRLAPFGYGFMGVLMLANITLNVLNKPFHASVLTLTQMFVLYIPLAYVGSYLFGVVGIFGAVAIANIIAGLAAHLWLKRVLAVEQDLLINQPASVPDPGPLTQTKPQPKLIRP